MKSHDHSNTRERYTPPGHVAASIVAARKKAGLRRLNESSSAILGPAPEPERQAHLTGPPHSISPVTASISRSIPGLTPHPLGPLPIGIQRLCGSPHADPVAGPRLGGDLLLSQPIATYSAARRDPPRVDAPDEEWEAWSAANHTWELSHPTEPFSRRENYTVMPLAFDPS